MINYQQGEIIHDEDEEYDKYIEERMVAEKEGFIRHFEEQDEEVQDDGWRR